MANWIEELERLVRLRDSGTISKIEFQRERDSIGHSFRWRPTNSRWRNAIVGSIIRDYRVIALEGQGAFGQVYKVQHSNLIAKAQGLRALS